MPGNLNRTVFFVSESTGITAETLGKSLLTQFPHIEFNYNTRSFIDTSEKANLVAEEINQLAKTLGYKPLVFATMPPGEIHTIISESNCHYYEIFESFLDKIGKDLDTSPTRKSGKSHGLNDQRQYDTRIDALNYALMHDDATILKNLGNADVIIVGVSRSGKTPTCLYMALTYGIKAANYPITSDDFDRGCLPDVILEQKERLISMTINPQRLHEIREKRRPNSEYSSLKNCHYELKEANKFYQRYGLKPLDVSTHSIEELASLIVKKLELNPQ